MAKRKKTSKKKTTTRKASGGPLSSKLNKLWKKAKPRTIGAPVPDGPYSARIETAIIEESRASKRPQVNWGLKIVEGDFAGRTVKKFSGLESEDNLDFLQGDLETLELAIPDALGDLGETLEQAPDILLEINVRTRDEFTNIDFIELLEDTGEYEDAAEGDAEEEEETEDAEAEEGTLEALTEDDDDADFEEFSKEIDERCVEAELDPDEFESWKDAEMAVREAEEEEEEPAPKKRKSSKKKSKKKKKK